MRFKAIIRIGGKLLIPPILLFAFYTQAHGELGPGGGFQAGVIFASAFILYALLFGVAKAREVAPAGVLRVTLAAPTLVSALLHAVAVVKAGVFCILKVIVYVFGIDVLRWAGATEWLVTVADVAGVSHPHFAIDGTFGFYSWYGFASCVAMVAAAKIIGVVLKRKDNYYDSE